MIVFLAYVCLSKILDSSITLYVNVKCINKMFVSTPGISVHWHYLFIWVATQVWSLCQVRGSKISYEVCLSNFNPPLLFFFQVTIDTSAVRPTHKMAPCHCGVAFYRKMKEKLSKISKKRNIRDHKCKLPLNCSWLYRKKKNKGFLKFIKIVIFLVRCEIKHR